MSTGPDDVGSLSPRNMLESGHLQRLQLLRQRVHDIDGHHSGYRANHGALEVTDAKVDEDRNLHHDGDDTAERDRHLG